MVEKLIPGKGLIFLIREKKNSRAPDIFIKFMEPDGTELKFVGWEKVNRKDEIYYTIEKAKTTNV